MTPREQFVAELDRHAMLHQNYCAEAFGITFAEVNAARDAVLAAYDEAAPRRMAMTDTERDRLVGLAEKATPGPWIWRDSDMHGQHVCNDACYDDEHFAKAIITTDSGYYGPNADDRAFIAAAHDMIALIKAQSAEIERLRAVLAEALTSTPAEPIDPPPGVQTV